ncbi:serine proteinase stubble-like [Mercenaria mercenaria]|uniref:serine proteinase stubble-like n=1 Tax=Mercenaria mercenaria TaxID=6596 RepID=UPI001E1D77A3|nr:serine proteinase stubble-like [Mercenaria mercenaria]
MEQMAAFTLFLILASLVTRVPAEGNTRKCLICPKLVKDPSECTEIHHCQSSRFCVTEVYHLHGENRFRYGCGGGAFSSKQECKNREYDNHHQHGPSPPEPVHETLYEHHWGRPLCRECHNHWSSQQDSCSQYFLTTTRTPVKPVTHAPPTTMGQSQSASEATKTTPIITTPTKTTTPTTTIPDASATTKQNFVVTVPTTQTRLQPCMDFDDVTFSCADMKFFGYCNPDAGAGYVLAQKRCRKTCGLC